MIKILYKDCILKNNTVFIMEKDYLSKLTIKNGACLFFMPIYTLLRNMFYFTHKKNPYNNCYTGNVACKPSFYRVLVSRMISAVIINMYTVGGGKLLTSATASLMPNGKVGGENSKMVLSLPSSTTLPFTRRIVPSSLNLSIAVSFNA